MADITKIIKGLGEATALIERKVPERYIGYSKQACIDACKLLKDQQPKKPHYSVLRYLVNGQVMMIDHPECPKCFENGFRLYEAEIEKGQKYCKRCGQAIDWSKDGEQE